MSLLTTKPRYAPNCVATERGWCDPKTGEVLVSIGNLKSKLEAESPKMKETFEKIISKVIEVVVEPTPEKIIEKEIVMQPETPVEVKQRKQYAPRKPKVIGEVVEQPIAPKIIAEVVEYDLDTKVIGE